MVLQVWEVVGGGDKGGIVVRSGKDTASAQADVRLATGALVEELELDGERLHYKVLEGAGPPTGWVSTRLKDKELMAKTDKAKAKQRSEHKEREAQGNARAAEGPGPHNGPTVRDLEDFFMYVSQLNAYPEQGGEQEKAGEADQPFPEPAEPFPEPFPEAGLPAVPSAPKGWLSRLGLERVANFRDAAYLDGGRSWRCTGGTVRRGLLFRTGQWNSATKSDLAKIMNEFGVKTYIDLRTGKTFEGGAAPCYDEYPPCPSGRHGELPERPPGERRRVHCPFTKDLNMRGWTADEKALSVPKEDRKANCSWWYQQLMRNGSFQMNLIMQLSCTMRAILFMNHDEVLKAMKVMSNPANFPVAYGCMAGKDRTGILGQLVLSALGVSQEDILTDYLATNDSSAHIDACIKVCMAMYQDELKRTQPRQYEVLAKRGHIIEGVSTDPTSKKPLWEEPNVASSEENLKQAQVYKEIMQYTFHVLDTECGGVLNYLAEIGFGEEDVASMRSILVEPDA